MNEGSQNTNEELELEERAAPVQPPIVLDTVDLSAFTAERVLTDELMAVDGAASWLKWLPTHPGSALAKALRSYPYFPYMKQLRVVPRCIVGLRCLDVLRSPQDGNIGVCHWCEREGAAVPGRLFALLFRDLPTKLYTTTWACSRCGYFGPPSQPDHPDSPLDPLVEAGILADVKLSKSEPAAPVPEGEE